MLVESGGYESFKLHMLETAYSVNMDDGERRGVYKLFFAIETLGTFIADDSGEDPDLYPQGPIQ